MNIEDRLAYIEPFIQIFTSQVCKDPSIRDDVMQEARIVVCRIDSDHHDVGHGYYVNSVKNAIITAVKRRSWTGSERRPGNSIDPLRRQTESIDVAPEQYDQPLTDHDMLMVETGDIREAVRQAVAKLDDDREREMVFRLYWAEQTQAEIGSIFGLSKSRVAFYLSSARSKLRESLEKIVYDPPMEVAA
jgi:RNA polymerase sigma factor (sigma-70 family)